MNVRTNFLNFTDLKVVALAGGVGGARLADGLAQVLPAENLTVIVNTGDDFEYLGLHISPDLDTVCYTLAGLENPVTGWGRQDETWKALETLASLGGPTWFRLGDQDLGLHIERTRLIQDGSTISQITTTISKSFGIQIRILPMSDNPVPTWVQTDEGELGFQDYFVRLKCQPWVSGFRFGEVQHAEPAPGVLFALSQADLVVFCPSNPWVSIDPILAIPGIREEVSHHPAVAVSPIIGGQTIKGPAAKMFIELGIQPSAIAVWDHYKEILHGFVLDQKDSNLTSVLEAEGIAFLATDTIMNTRQKRALLAKEVIEFGISSLIQPRAI